MLSAGILLVLATLTAETVVQADIAISPPSYPSPWADGSGGWEDAYERARLFVDQLTLLEKINLTTGTGWQSDACVGQTGSIPRLGFRGLCLQDSPQESNYDSTSFFPSGITVAATWDRNLMYLRGYAQGAEHRDKGVNVLLGPVASPLGRSPAGGRYWEGFGPDPVLTGIAFSETIRGIQDAGVVACAKHFIANEQEHFRMGPEAVSYGFNVKESLSSNIDDKTMHELYLWPFADAVRIGVGSFMCAYNQVNNSYSCENSYLINHLLKGELGFQGFVMSDWMAQHSGVSSALAGLDQSMPGDTVFNSGSSYWGSNLTLAVLNGSVPEWRVEDMATRIMAAYYKVENDKVAIPISFNSWTGDTFGPEHFYQNSGYGKINHHVYVRGNHAKLARDVASHGTVLLKNTENALPLQKPWYVGVFGEDAGSNKLGPNGCWDRGCNNGTLGSGWGSGTAVYPYLVSPESALQVQALQDSSTFQAVTNSYAYPQIRRVASEATVALVFVNANSGEGYIEFDGNYGDRNNLTLWGGGEELIKTVAGINPNTVVIIHSVGPVLIGDWYDHENVTAIVWAGLPGQESGNAITDVLYGRVNPGGKSPFTWARAREDYGTDVLYEPNADIPQSDFTEGVFTDYRAFDRSGTEPIYEFGYGISYTTFSYSEIQVKKQPGGRIYEPTTGLTRPAPDSTNKIGANMANDQASIFCNSSVIFEDYTFPEGFVKEESYIYSWLMSSNPKIAAGSADYDDGNVEYIPKNAHDSSAQNLLPAAGGPGGNPALYDVLYEVIATVRNTGSTYGEEVVQMYVSLGGSTDPKLVLRGFSRLRIPPGESATFRANLTRRDLSNWDVKSQNWVISNADKKVYVGASSRNLPLSSRLK